jgi:hypothetical protein
VALSALRGVVNRIALRYTGRGPMRRDRAESGSTHSGLSQNPHLTLNALTDTGAPLNAVSDSIRTRIRSPSPAESRCPIDRSKSRIGLNNAPFDPKWKRCAHSDYSLHSQRPG